MARLLMLTLSVALLGLGGCVKRSTHNAALDLLAQTEARVAELEQELAATTAQLRAELTQREGELSMARDSMVARQTRIANLQDRILQLENEANRLSTLLNQRGDEAELLRSRLDALSALEEEIRERNQIYEDVIGRFRSLIEAGALSVSISRGRLVINLPQDILFPSGSAMLGADGRETLTQVAQVLADIPDREFQVEGHTDDVPIATARFPSNWELAAARALSVVHLLQLEGVSPENVSGAAFSEYRPVADNEDPEGRRVNRRIEIVMLPNLDVIAGASLPPE